MKISKKSLPQRFLCSLFCHCKPYALSQFSVLSLSLDINVMATSKRCVKLFFRLFLFLNISVKQRKTSGNISKQDEAGENT